MTQEEKRERNRLYNKKYRERHPDRVKKAKNYLMKTTQGELRNIRKDI